MRITADDISVSRQGRRVLSDLTCEIEPGRCLAVVGPNGAGKTTLLQTLLGLIPADRGRITIDGILLEKLSRREIAKRIAYLPQQYEGFLGFRVRDLVTTGRYAHLHALAPPGPEDHRIVEAALAECGVAELADRVVETLSGGERQKVFLAAAVAQEAPCLLLDEPAASLDPKHQAELVALIRRLIHAGKTVVIVCHDLNLPTMLDARILGLKDGRVLLDGPVRELRQVENLKTLFETDFAILHSPDGETCLIGLHV